jgi:hypothetical protein
VAGPAGATGATGATGPAGKIELVTCTDHHSLTTGKPIYETCTTKLTSAVVKFTIPVTPKPKTVSARILHAGHIEASGTLRDGKLLLHSAKALPAGSYRLELTAGTGKHKRTQYSTITIS